MKMEFVVNGTIVVVEAEGSFSVHLREGKEAVKQDTTETVVNPMLYARLVALRKELAVASNVPPYVVFNDKTLREMATCLPSDLTELSTISGVGQVKLEKYGSRFLEIINAKGAA